MFILRINEFIVLDRLLRVFFLKGKEIKVLRFLEKGNCFVYRFLREIK